MGLIDWCDSNISKLKQNKINFLCGRPQVPEHMRYDEVPEYIETYQFRNEIPIESRKKSLICFYSMEDRLWNRLKTIDSDCKLFSNFAGIVGMDISPSVNMLRPRQLHSILINCIYDCLVALKGIKVAINSRIGDFGTNNIINEYPKNKTLVFGNLGCKGRFASYSFLQFKEWLKIEKPTNICLYGTLLEKDIKKITKLNRDVVINLYHCHNFKNLDNMKKSVFVIGSNKHTINTPVQGYVLDYILSHGIQKIKSHLELTEMGGDNYEC